MLKLMNDKRAVVGKGMAWTGRALRQQQQHTQLGAAHYNAEVVWHKGETTFDSAQQQVVPIVQGKIPGTNVQDEAASSNMDEDMTRAELPDPPMAVALEGAALPAKTSSLEVDPSSKSRGIVRCNGP